MKKWLFNKFGETNVVVWILIIGIALSILSTITIAYIAGHFINKFW